MRLHPLAAILPALAFVPALQAQQVVDASDPNRKTSTVFVLSDSGAALAGVSISYSQPDWQDSYDGMFEQLAGSHYTVLGKHWWTGLDTIGTIEIGGTKIEAGSYYLGLAVDEDGVFSLLVFDSKQAMKSGLLPLTTALYTGDAKAETKAPLTLARGSLAEVVVKLEIKITADEKDPATGRFSIRWGKHELSAPVKFELAVAKEATDPKK